jgi:DNA-binding IclR family transcriptional regulator
MSSSDSDGAATSMAAEHRTVSRVMAVLETVVAREPNGVRLGDLSAPIGAPKSSIHGLAKGLVAVGYLREQDGRYFTGPAVFSLLGSGHPSLPAAYHHALEELTAKWEETTLIATLVGDSVVYVDIVDSPRLIRAAPTLHKRAPLWPRSSGKCFLAFAEPRRRDAILRRTVSDAAERDRIKEELAQVRASSVAINVGEIELDQSSAASPIVIASAPVTMAIVLAGPASRMAPHLDEIAESVRSAATALSTVR